MLLFISLSRYLLRSTHIDHIAHLELRGVRIIGFFEQRGSLFEQEDLHQIQLGGLDPPS